MTDRKAQKRRLERAGYVHLSGWVPNWPEAVQFAKFAAKHLPEVERIAAEPPRPRGRPKKEAAE